MQMTGFDTYKMQHEYRLLYKSHNITAHLLSLNECASTVWCLTLFFFFCLRMTATGTGDLCTK